MEVINVEQLTDEVSYRIISIAVVVYIVLGVIVALAFFICLKRSVQRLRVLLFGAGTSLAEESELESSASKDV